MRAAFEAERKQLLAQLSLVKEDEARAQRRLAKLEHNVASGALHTLWPHRSKGRIAQLFGVTRSMYTDSQDHYTLSHCM